jgi:fructosamine-3-kinase
VTAGDKSYKSHMKGLNQLSFDRSLVFMAKADLDNFENLTPQADCNNESLNSIGIVQVAEEIFGKIPLSASLLKGSGTFHIPYRINFSENERYILRTSSPRYPYRAIDFYLDTWAMGVLGKEKLPTIQIYSVDTSRARYPYDYEVLDEAKGTPLTLIKNDSLEKPRIMFQLGLTMAKIHNIRTSGFGLLDIDQTLITNTGTGVLKTWKEYVFLNVDRHLKFCADVGSISLDDGKRIQAIFEKNENILEETKPSLLHGDLSNQNIFWDGESISALIDWEDCLSGDPIFDIASWGSFIGNAEKLDLFLKGYRSVTPLPDIFNLKYWFYNVRIILAKTVFRYRFNLTDRIPAPQRIRKSLEMLERASSGRQE